VGCRCSRGSATVYCFVGFLDRYSPSIVRGFFLRGRSASLSRSVPWSQRVLPESTTKDIPSFRSRRSRSWLLLLLRIEQRGKDLRNPVRYEAPEHTTVRKVERGSDRTNACFLPSRSEGTVPFPSHSWAYGTHVVTRREGKVHFLCACRGALVRKDFVPSRGARAFPTPGTYRGSSEGIGREGRQWAFESPTVRSTRAYHRKGGGRRNGTKQYVLRGLFGTTGFVSGVYGMVLRRSVEGSGCVLRSLGA